MRLRPKALRDAAPHQEGVEKLVIVAEGSALVVPKGRPSYLRELETLSFRGDVPHIYASDRGSTLIVILKYGAARVGPARRIKHVGMGRVTRQTRLSATG